MDEALENGKEPQVEVCLYIEARWLPWSTQEGASLVSVDPDNYRFRYSLRPQFARRQAVCFQRGLKRVKPRILAQPPVVNKVYRADQPDAGFSAMKNQPLAGWLNAPL